MLIPNIQHFAEGDPSPGTPQQAEPQTYSAEYVSALKSESIGHRLAAKNHEKALRSILGLAVTDDLGDLDARVTAYQQELTQKEAATLQAANNRLIQAELKALEGYDHKLLSRVIDLKDVKVDDNGNVTGIKEAVDAAAKEFPAVKSAPKKRYAPENPVDPQGSTANQRMNDLIRGRL